MKEWIQNIVIYLLLMSLVRQCIPNDKYRKYIQLTMGMILILILLTPMMRVLGIEETLDISFFQNQIQMFAFDAKSSGEMFDSEQYFNESYQKIISDEITAYFETQGMTLCYCQIHMNENINDEDYGQIYALNLGICQKDRMISEETKETYIYIENIEKVDIGKKRAISPEAVNIPDEKVEEWKQTLSDWFGIDKEQLYVEITA